MGKFRDSIHDIILGERLSDNMYLDNNGQLICENVVLARTGSYDYLESELMDDGDPNKVVQVYRTPEEVFNPISIKSMNYKPFVDEHPEENVTPDTVSALQKGFMTNVRRGTGEFSECLMADLVVTDPYVIEEIRSGKKRELSVGYTADIEEVNGKYYMKNIRGNHIALCSAGRAGNARIRDSKTVVGGEYADFEAKGSFDNLDDLISFYKGATTEARDGGIVVRLQSGVKLFYSFLNGTSGKLLFVRRLTDSDGTKVVEVLGDSVKFKEGQRVKYFGTDCVVSRIYPLSGKFFIELTAGGNVAARFTYDQAEESVNAGVLQLCDSVVFDSKSGKFGFVANDSDYSSSFTDKDVADAEVSLTNLPDSVSREEFDKLYFKLRDLTEKKWNYRVSTYGDRFKIEVAKAVGATQGTYGPIGGKWKVIKTIYCTDGQFRDPLKEKELDRTHFIDGVQDSAPYKRGDKVKPREGGSIEEIVDIVTESTGSAGSGKTTKKYVMKSGRKYTAEDLEGSAWTLVRDSGEGLKRFRVVVDGRTFETNAHSAAHAAQKVARALKDANFSGDWLYFTYDQVRGKSLKDVIQYEYRKKYRSSARVTRLVRHYVPGKRELEIQVYAEGMHENFDGFWVVVGCTEEEAKTLRDSCVEDSQDITALRNETQKAYQELKKYRKGTAEYQKAFAAWGVLHEKLTKAMYGGSTSYKADSKILDGVGRANLQMFVSPAKVDFSGVDLDGEIAIIAENDENVREVERQLFKLRIPIKRKEGRFIYISADMV